MLHPYSSCASIVHLADDCPLIFADEYVRFQQWKRQQRMASTGGPGSAGPEYSEPPAFNVDEVKASAVETVDKALDVLLMQVQGLKEVSPLTFFCI